MLADHHKFSFKFHLLTLRQLSRDTSKNQHLPRIEIMATHPNKLEFKSDHTGLSVISRILAWWIKQALYNLISYRHNSVQIPADL